MVINGPSRFLGFLGNDELTRSSLTDWGGFRTGDIGTLDADGYFTFVGRDKDIIRRGGLTIVPTEIEVVLLRHPAIREVALVGVDDERLGERACAARDPAAEGEPHRRSRKFSVSWPSPASPSTAWPERLEVFEEFPRTPSLKAVKREIRADVAARVGGGPKDQALAVGGR